MGLFSFVGDLLGGGSNTQVQQQVQNTTTTEVGVTVQNNVDLTPIQQALQQLGQLFSAQTDASTVATAAQASGFVSVAAAIADASSQARAQTQTFENKLLPWVKLISAAVALYLLAGVWRKWK